MNTHPEPEPLAEDWLPELLRRAGVSPSASLGEVQARMDRLADEAAPVARSGWKWLVLIQGISVAAPVLWLMRRPLGLPPAGAALAALGAALLLAGGLWWLRWRGMQRTWARARLVAEVARSRLASAVSPTPPPLHVLETLPTLRHLPAAVAPTLPVPWPEWRDRWLTDRVEDQLRYFRTKREQAEKTRRQFSRWTTLCMDATLALAAAGVVVTLSRRAPQWLRVLGDYRLELALGALGALLPLGVILLQALRHMQELNRRTARFAGQIAMLEKARRQLAAATTPEEALRLVAATEDRLLEEVVDWYFEAETAEQFFQVRHTAPVAGAAPVPAASRRGVLGWVLALGGVSLLFLGRVVLGRAPWVVGASAITLGWLSYATPTDPEARSRLHVEGRLLTETGQPWQPDAERAEHGCVIIAHGLHDGVLLRPAQGETAWMQAMSAALHSRLGERTPNIGLLDWAEAANPTNIHRIDPGITAAKFGADVAGIRPEAQEIGDALAFRLAQCILENKIRRDRPLHLIGHSAGGFVVARAARVLGRMNLAPQQLQVTILDTPGPDSEMLVELPKVCTAEFYITSGFVLGLDENTGPSGLHVRKIPTEKTLSLLQAHSFAHDWFTRTIPTAHAGEKGFGRSPFCPN